MVIVDLVEGYGPNDADVLRFLERVSHLTPDEARRLIDARLASADPDGAEAAHAIGRAALMSGRTEQLEAAHAAIRASGRTWGVPWFGRARRVYWDRHIRTADAQVLGATMPILLDTVGAIVVRDVLTPAQAAAFLAPWSAATGHFDARSTEPPGVEPPGVEPSEVEPSEVEPPGVGRPTPQAGPTTPDGAAGT